METITDIAKEITAMGTKVDEIVKEEKLNVKDYDDVSALLSRVSGDEVAKRGDISLCFDRLGNVSDWSSDCTVQVGYWSGKLKKYIVLESDFPLNFDSIDEVVMELNNLLDECESIEQRII